MLSKRTIQKVALSLDATGALLPVAVAPAAGTATITISHQMRGCHAWSVNNGPVRPTLAVNLKAGATVKFVNNDIMPHQVVRTSGPGIAVKLVKTGHGMGIAAKGVGMMSHMGATVKITFSAKGVYKLTTDTGNAPFSG